MDRIIIAVENISINAELLDTPTGRKISKALPLEGSANVWGDEIYFEIPVKSSLEKEAREVVERGHLGYWPPGSAFCIFFGPTPASQGKEIRAASAVNIIGKVSGDATRFKGVPPGAKVRIEKA